MKDRLDGSSDFIHEQEEDDDEGDGDDEGQDDDGDHGGIQKKIEKPEAVKKIGNQEDELEKVMRELEDKLDKEKR